MDSWLERASLAGVERARIVDAVRPATVQIEGTCEGRRVRLMRIAADDAHYFAISTPIEPAMDLGLYGHPVQFVRNRMRCGHDGLDQEYVFGADDAHRLQALFRGDVAERLYRLHCDCMTATLRDDSVTVSGAWSDDDPWPPAGVQATVEMAALLDASRQRVPAALAIALHREAWSALAARLQGELRSTPFQVRGTFEELPVEALARREQPGRYRLELGVRHREPLGLGLRITQMRSFFDPVGIGQRVGALFGAQDVRVGDAAFDHAFRIQVEPGREPALVAALDGPTRALLDAVRGSAPGVELALDDERALAMFPEDAPPDALPRAVDLLVDASQRLSRALRMGPERSAYRG